MNGSRAQRKPSREFVFFLLLLAVCAAARCVLSVLVRTGTSCWDEALNLKLAQGIRAGKLTLYGLPTGHAGILYPALLAPFFGIGDPETRMRAIAVLNALLVTSSLIPARLTCRKLLKKESYRTAAVLLFALLPDLWVSVTCMAENLYIPLAVWGIWFLLRAFGKGTPDFRASCGLGLWAFLLFLTAQSSAAMIVGTLALFLYEAGTGKDGKKALAGCLGFTAAFAAAYLLVMFAFFGGRAYLYPGLAGGWITSPAQLMFWLVAGLCVLLWFSAGALFFPVLVPVACRKRQDGEVKGLTLFLTVYAAAAALLTAYAVSVPEEFGRMDIRIILRSFIPAGWMFTVLFLAMPGNGEEKAGIRHPLVSAAAGLAILCVLFLRIPANGSLTDAPALRILGFLSGGRTQTAAVKAAAAVFIAAGTVLWITNRRKTVTACVLAALMALGAVNGFLTLRQAGQERVPAEQEAQAKALGTYLAGLDGNVLAVVSDPENAAQRLMDTFCDTDYRLIETDALRKMALEAEEEGMIPTEGTAWTEGEKTGALHFRKDTENGIGPVGYIVCHEGELKLSGAQYTDCTPEGITFAKVWRNEDPGRIDAQDLFAFRPGDEIRITKENPDHLRFPVSGFSTPESGFTWSEGKETTITLVPAPEEEASLEILWTWKMTNGQQSYEVYAGDVLLCEGSARGKGSAVIPVPDELTGKREPVTVRFVFPDAKQPANGDPRVLAVAFESVVLQERQDSGE